MSLSAEIGWAVMKEISLFDGCDIEEIVNDNKLYGELVDDVIYVIESKLQKLADKIDTLLLDMD